MAPETQLASSAPARARASSPTTSPHQGEGPGPALGLGLALGLALAARTDRARGGIGYAAGRRRAFIFRGGPPLGSRKK